MPFAGVRGTDSERETVRSASWDQLGWIQPESYLADGYDVLTFVTTNRELYELVLAGARADGA
ncbi:MAG: hypothetical protein EXQ47_06460 [Bryobacterales bacterium]|nr:hypothetical protein [Bryobacterales bacterium]